VSAGAAHAAPMQVVRRTSERDLAGHFRPVFQPARLTPRSVNASGILGVLLSNRKGNEMDNEKKTVLLVDDDEDLLERARVVVAQEFNVELAHSGEEALAMLGKKRFDCIVMDVMMNSLSDGLDAAKKIKENSSTKTIPVIMVTSVNEHFDYRTQVDESFFPNDRWLDKPVDANVLLGEIKRLVGTA
jgi:CheY-like chemotaxis protein